MNHIIITYVCTQVPTTIIKLYKGRSRSDVIQILSIELTLIDEATVILLLYVKFKFNDCCTHKIISQKHVIINQYIHYS